MARPPAEHYELSPAEKRDLIALIEKGKPLPEKYRFLLFADKREEELVWNDKSREVCDQMMSEKHPSSTIASLAISFSASQA